MRAFSLCGCLLLLGASSPMAAPLTPGGAEAIARAVGHCDDPCVIVSNKGGRVMDFEDAGDAIRNGARKRLIIDGYCASSCMVLADRARPNTCITPRATFAYHKTNRNRPIPLRSDLDHWIRSNGGYPEFTGTPGIMPNQVARKYWPLCDPTPEPAKLPASPAPSFQVAQEHWY